MTWDDVLQQLLAEPTGARVTLSRDAIVHPREAGVVASAGLPAPGKVEDWRFKPTPNCAGLHVHEHADRWVAHLDQVHPACDPIEHLRVDAPAAFVGAASLVGVLLGAIIRGGVGGVVGGVAGTFLGTLLVLPRRRA